LPTVPGITQIETIMKPEPKTILKIYNVQQIYNSINK